MAGAGSPLGRIPAWHPTRTPNLAPNIRTVTHVITCADPHAAFGRRSVISVNSVRPNNPAPFPGLSQNVSLALIEGSGFSGSGLGLVVRKRRKAAQFVLYELQYSTSQSTNSYRAWTFE